MYIVFGFIGAAALIILAKKILYPLLCKGQDIYEDGGEHNE